jgi:hypothetical protein
MAHHRPESALPESALPDHVFHDARLDLLGRLDRLGRNGPCGHVGQRNDDDGDEVNGDGVGDGGGRLEMGRVALLEIPRESPSWSRVFPRCQNRAHQYGCHGLARPGQIHVHLREEAGQVSRGAGG